MNVTISRIYSSLRQSQQATVQKYNREQLIAVLQGITGFASAIFQGDIFGVIDTALGIANHVNNLQCLTSLKSVIRNAKAWLTFGKYRPLNDSSDLNFDKMNVSSVPDMMKVCTMQNYSYNVVSFFMNEYQMSTFLAIFLYCRQATELKRISAGKPSGRSRVQSPAGPLHF